MPKTKLIYLAIVLLYCSCFKGVKTPPVATPYFDSVIAKADRISDSGDKAKALAFVINEHRHAKNLTVMDDLNYFVYCAEMYRRDRKDYDKYLVYADSMLACLEKNDQREYASFSTALRAGL